MSEDKIQSNQELENISDDDSSSEENLSLSEEKPEEEILKIEDVEPSEFESSITNQQKRSLADELDSKREDTRSKLATILITILVGTYIFSFLVMLIVIIVPVDQNEEKEQRYTYSKDVISLLITTQTGLIGAVLGFYFGSNRNK